MSILVANRLLPEDLADRDDWEKGVFWGAWVLALAHAAWRSAAVQRARISPAWREQCWAVAALALTAVVLNWITTGDHLLKTIGRVLARGWVRSGAAGDRGAGVGGRAAAETT